MSPQTNKKVLAQVNSVFAYSQAMQSGLAFKGLASADSSLNATVANGSA